MTKSTRWTSLHSVLVGSILLSAWGCTPHSMTPVSAANLGTRQAATLNSLAKIDGHPLYTMRYHGPYDLHETAGATGSLPAPESAAWACALFAAMGNADDMVYGRNFDWHYSPAVLLFTNPPDGYASVSMVDIAYLGFDEYAVRNLTDLPLAERMPLVYTPFLPFDGMNERGLVVGMAAVPQGRPQPDPNKPTVDSLMLIRRMLDEAATVDQAIAIARSCSIDPGKGPPLHYLIADRSGGSALVEYYNGDVVVTPSDDPWHLATNFLLAAAGDSVAGKCRRYDRLSERLTEAAGKLRSTDAFVLLADIAQETTQWSVVYRMSAGKVAVVMKRQWDSRYAFGLTDEPVPSSIAGSQE